jgi:hypothetical protein
MNSEQIEKKVKEILNNFSKEEFIFDLLLAYGTPKATVTLLKKGRHNLSKKEDRIILKRKLFFQQVEGENLHVTIDDLQKNESTMRHKPRFIIVTNFDTLLAVDTKTDEQLDISLKDIAKHFVFFLPWAGIEKHKHTNENPADRKAAEKMARLYDGIVANNSISGEKRTHELNIFLSRLLFCFFAEDTGIYENGVFTNGIASHTQSDGSDLDTYFAKLFRTLNTEDTSKLPAHLQQFPYVNGGLFAEETWVPKCDAKCRNIIIECGELDWAEINPDIFGSMIQAVVIPGQRESLGMHYTSVPNIMKVIEPLFLNELREEFEKNSGNKKKLQDLLGRISKIKFFDPACGSGNFLIITYKELRRLEMEIIEELGSFSFSSIQLSQFYGIEIDDFAHEMAKLSLYLSQHQMNVEFLEKFKKVKPTLPLKESGNITLGNAARLDWEKVCPKKDNDEIYIFGNPPYLGYGKQNKEQKEDIAIVFSEHQSYKKLDYISCWFYKSVKYITHINAKSAFVSTNSITQGEQVPLLWPLLLKGKIEIHFAYTSFKWRNNARAVAGVTVVIIGLRNIVKQEKFLFIENKVTKPVNISPYLTAGKNLIVEKRSRPLSLFPVMMKGSQPTDGGHLLLNRIEKDQFLIDYPELSHLVKKFYGAKEFIQNEEKYCFWIEDTDLDLASSSDFILKRLQLVEGMRLASSKKATNKLANRPHRFGEVRYFSKDCIIVPTISSERRKYIPCGFLDRDTVVSNTAQVIYDYSPFLFGIVSSKMQMIWMKAVGGKFESNYIFSSSLCYNTFPLPSLSEKQKSDLTQYVYQILEERERHPEKTIAQMYDPDKMPEGLLDAHHQLDLAVERIYRSKPFKGDEERLEYLFKLYERMIEDEKTKDPKNNLL